MPELIFNAQLLLVQAGSRMFKAHEYLCNALNFSLVCWLMAMTTMQMLPSGQATAAPSEAIGKLNEVLIQTQDVFETGPGKLRRVRKLVNHLHWETRGKVIRRQLWFKQGDLIKDTDVEELERNLRALDLFASVSVSTRPATQGEGWVDLIIITRDRLSLILSGSGSFLGGIGSVKFSAGETNLFGLGQRFEVGYSETTSGELRGSLGYDNVLLFGSDIYGGIKLGQTEEGDFAELSIKNRFKNLTDSNSWLVKLKQEDTKIDFYSQGVSVAEVPRTLSSVALQKSWRRGRENRFWRFGPSLSWSDIQYGQINGNFSDDIQVPTNIERIFLGGFTGYDRFVNYKKVTWLDTLSFKQDLSLGFGATLLAGFEKSVTASDNTTVPLIIMEGWTRHQLGPHNYLGASLESRSRIDNSERAFWSIDMDLSWYNTWLRQQTLAINLNYKTTGDDESELPVRQSLGENNGLRGYPAREFNGQQSLLLNIENRIRTPLHFASFDFGVIGFFDTGWVNDRDQGLQDPHASVGLGLRIGSRAILGRGVIRIDLAYPLDDDPVRDFQPTVSLAVGQVFDFNKD